MAAKSRKLKVYQATFGFHDSVVAAPNQAAALKAWGVRQNLFAEGQASVSTDPQATKAALQHPETPLRRTVGTKTGFELEPTALPTVPKAPKKAPAPSAKSRAKEATAPKPAKPPPDRRPLTAAESAVRSLDDRRRREEDEFRRRQEALAEEAADAQARYVAAKRQAETALETARKHFVDAGGDPKTSDPG